ncbi:MAG: hypothetical protein PHY47_17170 [Lachnospiraceae bacterium]|nr:hypothetical protein [Lachnospiraceae bacterium]
MNIIELLDELKKKAQKDPEIRRAFLDSRNEKNPVEAFCRVCQSMGYPIYEMELINAGEDFHATMKRSTNGGGENSPALEYQEDFYELFFAGL